MMKGRINVNIGSVLSGFDRFAGISGSRTDGAQNAHSASSATGGSYAVGGENVNDPSRVSGAWNAEDGKGANGAGNGSKKGRFDKNECQTCKNRSYQDGSNDPGVSFKSPTKMSPDQAATAVLGHEMEHVTRNQAQAKAEGREVLSQSVVLHSGICPECGRTYIAGGETRTVTGERQKQNPFDVGKADSSKQSGRNLDAVA